MRIPVFPILAGAVFLLTACPAFAADEARHICIDTRNIRNSNVKDHGAAILFQMNDGTQWRNELQGKCPDLDFEGYVWTIRNPDGSVCEFEQTLRVLQSGEVCTLGKFTRVTPTSFFPALAANRRGVWPAAGLALRIHIPSNAILPKEIS